MYDEEYETYSEFIDNLKDGGYDGYELLNADDVPGWGGLKIHLRDLDKDLVEVFIKYNVPKDSSSWLTDGGRLLVEDIITPVGSNESDTISKAVKITINIDNAAFNDPDGKPDPYYQNLELSRILERLAKDVRGMGGLSGNIGDYINLHDINGNYVGVCEVVEDEQ